MRTIVSIIVPVRIMIAMLLAVMRDELVAIPAVLHKIDRPVTGAVLRAVTLPVAFMARRNAQINGFANHAYRYRTDDDGPFVDGDRARRIANIDRAVKTRLTNSNGDANIGCCKCAGS
ncbi:hypothetical protein GCM10028811_02290 [Uliginosibacterium sediminicola]